MSPISGISESSQTAPFVSDMFVCWSPANTIVSPLFALTKLSASRLPIIGWVFASIVVWSTTVETVCFISIWITPFSPISGVTVNSMPISLQSIVLDVVGVTAAE